MKSVRLIIIAPIIVSFLFVYHFAYGQGIGLENFASSFGNVGPGLPGDTSCFDTDNDSDIDGIDLARYCYAFTQFPQITFSLTPQIISVGESSTLNWDTSYAYSISIDNQIGSVEPKGSLNLFPIETARYTITAEGPGGTTKQSFVLYVISPDKTCFENQGDFSFSIDYPLDGLVIPLHDGPFVTVTGTNPSFSDCFQTEVLINGEPATIDGNSFSGGAFLERGDNSIVVECIVSSDECCSECLEECRNNCAGGDCEADCLSECEENCEGEKDSWAQICVSYGASGTFDIVINEPLDGETVHYPSLTLHGYVSDPSASVTVNGMETNADNEGYFEANVSLREGENTITASARRGNETAFDTVEVAYHPLLDIKVLEPDGKYDLANNTYLIRWSDVDTDDNATVSIYYDTDNNGLDGTLIVDGLREDPDGDADEYLWDTSDVPEGEYYVYAVISDDKHKPIASYSDGPVRVNHQEFYFRGEPSTATEHFGSSVDISGDYAIVGDWGDNKFGERSGAAYIFKHDSSGWRLHAKLAASNLKAGDFFGHSVAISGDYAIIGAYGDDEGEEDSGAAYIFKREGEQWVEQEKLKAHLPGKVVLFGYSVDIDGAYAIVSAHHEITGYYSGAVYVFKRDNSDWIEQTKLIAGDPQNLYDMFGRAVSINGTYAVVGSEGEDASGIDSGSVYIFERNGLSWFEKARIVPKDAESGDKFGVSVAIGSKHAIGGAENKDTGGSEAGAVYVIDFNESGWTEQAELIASDPSAYDFFGCSVGISGDYAIIGASGDDDQGSSSGSAYIFRHDGSGWVQQSKILSFCPSSYDYFGRSVSMDGGYAIIGSSGGVHIFPVLTATISANAKTITVGEPLILTWDSTHADTCEIQPGIGEISTNGSITVYPTETTTYTLTASGLGDTTISRVTVTVNQPEPTVTISADPKSIHVGESTTLTWTSTNATQVTIDNGIGDVPLNGSMEVSPTSSTTYTITAIGPGGTDTSAITVNVMPPVPSVSITASPETIVAGQTSTLSWSSTNAETASIDNGIGSVDVNGSISVSPTQDTTYTITVNGPGGSDSASVTIKVTYPLPAVSITADPVVIDKGDSSTLTWSSSNADSCKIDPGIGSVEPNGSLAVSPAATTIYTIEASGPGGTITARVKVFVNPGNTYSYGDPTGAEQALLEAINRARANPSAEAARLGIDLNEGLPQGTIPEAPVQPLAFNTKLTMAAYFHSKDMVEHKYFGHDSSDGKSFEDRIRDAGYMAAVTGENIGARCSQDPLDEVSTVLQLHDGLFIDSEVEGRGHRLNILNADFKEIGIGIEKGCSNESPYGYVLTADFGSSAINGRSFLLGVVYDDKNHDGIYTAGEGVGNVQIEALESGSLTRTASAGGYAMRLSSGNYTIEAFLPDGRGAIRQVKIAQQNVKEDFLISEFDYLPPKVNLNAYSRVIHKGSPTTLSWQSRHANSASINNGVGVVPVNGSVAVSPESTTTYTITVNGPGGTSSANITIYVDEIPDAPNVSIAANPATIDPGGSSTLTWTSSNADRAFISGGVGSVALNDSITVSPQYTTTYRITVIGPGGCASSSVVVNVRGNPASPPEGSFGSSYKDLVPGDATVEEYDSRRFSVITGAVQTADESPLSGVTIAITDHPEYGSVKTDQSGHFALPVEGGAPLRVVYKKEGFISAQRQVRVPWNDIVVVETVRMIETDPVVTRVTFNGDPATTVSHESSMITDEFGSRSCTVVFHGDNRAYAVDSEGKVIGELTTIDVRATEYTTPQSMPAKLPPTSAYTYCVELSVDGTEGVRFEKPVAVWVDNFLGFDVGVPVPVGYYDRKRGVWVGVENGMVVKLLDTDGDGLVDAVDANGDGAPDDLDDDGDVSDEVDGLDKPGRYSPGDTFWRSTLTHFSPVDCNYPYAPPLDAIRPNPRAKPVIDRQVKKDDREVICSYVENRTRIFHEDNIPVAGTSIKLHYATDRVKGYKTVISVPVSGESVPDSLAKIMVEVYVAGKKFNRELEPLPDQIAEFTWDGTDFLGREVRGAVPVLVKIGFVYKGYYCEPAEIEKTFGYPGNVMTSIRSRQEIVFWNRSQFMIHRMPRYPQNLAEGWTLSNHHYMNPADSSILHKGDGTFIDRNIVSLVTTVAGTGEAGYGGDGSPAVLAKLYNPSSVAFDSAGNMYIADQRYSVVRKVDKNGIITTVAGIPGRPGYNGDNIPATQAMLYTPTSLCFDAEDNLYIADVYNYRVRKVDKKGIITTVIGTGEMGYSGDGGRATESQVTDVTSVACDNFGNLYMVDCNAHCVRKVDPNGIIHTVAGTGEPGYNGDGIPAATAKLNYPFTIAVDNSGSLYIGDGGNLRIRKVDTSGIISTVVGNGHFGLDGDGGPAIDATISPTQGIAFDASGNMYFSQFSEGTDCIRKVDTLGIITTVAGVGVPGYGGDGGPATEALFSQPREIALDEYGNIYVPDYDNNRIRKITTRSVCSGDIIFADENGLGYVMSATGLHESTFDLDTGVTLESFQYDENNNLVSITDQFGNEVTIERNASGRPEAIVSPDGQRTELTIDENNNLTKVSYADGSFYEFRYSEGNLLVSKTEPAGNSFYHFFDANGRIIEFTDEEGGDWTFTRSVDSSGDIISQTTTGEGYVTKYVDHDYSTGARSSSIIYPFGDTISISESADHISTNKTLPCDVHVDFKYGADAIWGFRFVKEKDETLASGLKKVYKRERSYADTDTNGDLDLITDTIDINDKTTFIKNNLVESRNTIISPEGRAVVTTYNPDTLLTTAVNVPGLYDTSYNYDSRGRLVSVQKGSRVRSFLYNDQGLLESVTDPMNRKTTYSYDERGRLIEVKRPDGSSIHYAYDNNGNMIVLVSPTNVSHEFAYNKVKKKSLYDTPSGGDYLYSYDKDRRLIGITYPSGVKINNVYDKARLIQVQTPEGNIDYSYECGEQVKSITDGTDTITYGYDGNLVTSETFSGTLNQSLAYTYNNDFYVDSFTYAGDTVNYSYDNDGLLIVSGNFSINRNAENGLPERVSDGVYSIERTFNGYGEIKREQYNINTNDILDWEVNRNDAGKIIEKTETAGDVVTHYTYTYDSLGRLITVTKNGTVVEEYQYDANGNRVHEVNSLRGISGRDSTYSDEDQLLTSGGVSYQYDSDGFLVRKTKGSEVTSYNYSSRGELISVSLPDGTIIEYEHDPLGRRIAKKVNGVVVEKYLWQGLARLLAVYGGNDNLLMRFEYADGRMPVSMTKNGTTYYLTYDKVGSVRIIADSSGDVVKRIDYDSFGNTVTDSNPSFKVPLGFAGGFYDADTGLIRFGYRDYDPDTGRWTAKDPIFFAGGDTNLYGYVLGDPVNLVDLYGLKWSLGSSFGILAADYGWDTSDPSKGNLNAAIGQLGGAGWHVTWTSDHSQARPVNGETIVIPTTWSVGLGKYLGVSFADDFSSFSFNIGLGVGLPITFSSPLEGDFSFGGWLYDLLHPSDDKCK